jgi:hypothetical protein
MQVLQIEVVKFHGTLVLLQNWSALNYAALVKILKKHGATTPRGCVAGPQPASFQRPPYSPVNTQTGRRRTT